MFSCTSKRCTWSMFITMVFEHTVQCDYNLHAWMCHQVFRYNSVVIWLRFQICCNKCCYIRIWSFQEKIFTSLPHTTLFTCQMWLKRQQRKSWSNQMALSEFVCQYYTSHSIERFLNTLFCKDNKRLNVQFNDKLTGIL